MGRSGDRKRDPYIRRQVRPAGHRPALLDPVAASEFRRNPAPEADGRNVSILERDLPRTGMLGDDSAPGLQPDPGPPHRPHHEETVEDTYWTGEAADDRESYGPVLGPSEDVASPVPILERRDQPLGPERTVRVRQLALELRHVVAEHQPQAPGHRTVGGARAAD